MTDFFLAQYKNADSIQILLEFIVFVSGIVSVLFAKKENIWVYPSGLLATIITTYLLYVAGYLGDMLLNGYFAFMSIYGWYMWGKSSEDNQQMPISRTTRNEKLIGIALFFLTLIVVYGVYTAFDQPINPDNYIDILSSGIFFTGMWYMARKKIENWTLWIIGDAIVVPLYIYRGLGMLALQYIIFTVLAIFAYLEWHKTLKNQKSIELPLK